MVVVVFTENNARIFKNPENHERFLDLPNAVIDPDLTAVERIPPHLWKLENGKVVPLEAALVEGREKHIEAFGAQNDITIPPAIFIPPKSFLQRVVESPVLKIGVFVSLAGALAGGLWHFGQ